MWIDKDLGIFKIIWVRIDNPEFRLETHAELFKRWASHTGKYRPGDLPGRGRRDFAVLCKKMSDIGELDQPDLRNKFATNRKGDTDVQT